MYSDPIQNLVPAQPRAELWYNGSYGNFLCNDPAISMQGSDSPPNGLLGHQGIESSLGRCHHCYVQPYQGYDRKRGFISRWCHSGSLYHHGCNFLANVAKLSCTCWLSSFLSPSSSFPLLQSSMLTTLERYLKQAIVDKLPSVSSAALVRSYHLTFTNSELVKRWVSEVQEALNSDKYWYDGLK